MNKEVYVAYPEKQRAMIRKMDMDDVDAFPDADGGDPQFGLRFWKTGQEIKDALTSKVNKIEVELEKLTTAAAPICKKNNLTFLEVLEEERAKQDPVNRVLGMLNEGAEESSYINKAQTSVMGMAGLKDRKNELEKLNLEVSVLQQLSAQFIRAEADRKYQLRIVNNIDAGGRFMLDVHQLYTLGF